MNSRVMFSVGLGVLGMILISWSTGSLFNRVALLEEKQKAMTSVLSVLVTTNRVQDIQLKLKFAKTAEEIDNLEQEILTIISENQTDADL